MKNFKVISEAEDSYHIKHENGKAFTVDKKGLSPKAHDAIKKMCGGGFSGYDEGGIAANQKTNDMQDYFNPSSGNKPAAPDIEKSDEQRLKELNAVKDNYRPLNTSEQTEYNTLNSKQNVQKIKNPNGFAHGGSVQKLNSDGTVDDDEDDSAEVPAAQDSAQASSTDVSAPSSITGNLQNYGSNYGKVLDQKLQATQAYQNQLDTSNANTQDAYNKTISALSPDPSVVALKPEQIQADMSKKDADFMQQLQQKGAAFDPNRYWNDMGTGHKILAGIALAIGGAGVGRNGTSLASQHLQTAINNDVEKQKADYSNTANLWKMNHQASQDQLQASLASKNQLMSVAQLQLAQQAASTNNAKEKLSTQMTLADLQNQKNQNNRAMGLLSQRSPGQDGKLPTDPSIIATQLIQDPAQRAAALKEIEQNESLEQGRQFAMANFNDLADKALGGKLSPSDRKGAVAATALKIAKNFSIRPNSAEDLADELLPGSGLTGIESDSTIQNKRTRLNQLFDMQKNNMGVLKSNTGLGPEDFPSTSSNPLSKLNPQETKMYNIAKAHPNHPDSIKFMKKYGIGQ